MLGDTDYSDTTYTGAPDTGGGVLSMDYYRNKAREFQVTLDAVSSGMMAAQRALDAGLADVDTDAALEVQGLLDDALSKRSLLRLTAEAINGGAAAVNAMGGRFPQLSIPTGLGLLPVIPVAAVAAIATAATLIAWGNTWLRGLNARLSQQALLEAVQDPIQRGELAAAALQAQTAMQASESSPLSSIAGMVKWGAIAFGAFLLYRAWSARN